MTLNIKNIGLFAAVMTVGFSAQAELIIDKNPAPPPPPVYIVENIEVNPILTYQGRQPTYIKKVRTSFEDKPAGEVINKIVPKNFKVLTVGNAIDENKKISVPSKDMEWNLALEEALYQSKGKANIDWSRKNIVVEKYE